ncbi:hypothetical protein LPW26_01930 [Rhodopseudomonas sp. HC1]|uniref:hypothetical protein n=1 Tax=Rhodopseudomonas infernalis TaxID=2897386 RepID=UPI001EE8C629|nr:hypothetical protein [Rhodopseudomonas infernalis]MCG6203385.1 hypothetical protein [Rhodopseudomonas infernalis]
MKIGISRIFRGLALGCLVTFFNASCEASSQTLSPDQLSHLREMIRGDIKPKFDEDARKLRYLAIQNDVKSNALRLAIQGLQTNYYNLSYIMYSCFISSLATTVDDIDPCRKKKIVAMAKTSGLAEYSVAREKSGRCEMGARIFEAEVEFPPFEFLAFDGNSLFDFDKLNRCLLE